MGVSLKKQKTWGCLTQQQVNVTLTATSAATSASYLNLVAKPNFYWSIWVLRVFSLGRPHRFWRQSGKRLLWSFCTFWLVDNSCNQKSELTLQAAGMVFDEELGLGFCEQGGHTVHDLYPAVRWTVGIWTCWKHDVIMGLGRRSNIKFSAVTVDDRTLLWDKLRGNSNIKWGEYGWVVTCHDVVCATCKLNGLSNCWSGCHRKHSR